MNQKQVYVVGDSLSDTGTFSGVTLTGRFTNTPGLIWTEIIARKFGASVAPAYIFSGAEFIENGGTNYAQSGALIAEENGLFEGKSRSVKKQLEMLSGKNHDLSSAILLLDGGGPNILRAAMSLGAGTLSPENAFREITEAGRLAADIAREAADAGFETVVWASVADFGRIPALGAGQGEAAAFTRRLSLEFNRAFEEHSGTLPKKLLVVNLIELFDEWAENGKKYGLENVTEPGIDQTKAKQTPTGNSANANPSHLVNPDAAYTYLFSDVIHPSARGHELLAEAVWQKLSEVSVK